MNRPENSDTSPAARERYTELMRACTPAERARILVGLCSAVRRLAEASVRQSHPAASPREVQARVALRMYGPAIVQRLFPDLDIS